MGPHATGRAPASGVTIFWIRPRTYSLSTSQARDDNEHSLGSERPQAGLTVGEYVRKLRLARALTQESLAERASLSTDTVRRIEGERMSPTIDTIRKLCRGLDVSLATLFAGLEQGRRDDVAELADYLRTRPAREQRRALRVVWALFED